MEAIKYHLSNTLGNSILPLIKDNSIISITDSLGRIEYASNDFCEILGCESNVIIGETHKLLKSHLHSDELYKDLWRTIKMGQKWNGVLSDNSYNGTPFWLDTTIIPIKDTAENNTKYVAIYNNVSKIYSENTKLQESNKIYAKYKSIYESVNVGIIVVVDSNGNITEWNKGAELAFGYSKLEILGHPLTLLMSKKIRKGNIKELLKAINKIKNNKNIDTIEMYCLRKNGEEFPVEFALSSIDGNNFYCAIMLDISKRKKLEYKLKQKTKDLEMFLYRSAHDLTAPFSSAEGLINLLKEEDANDRIKSLTEMLDTAINSGKLLVNNLTKASVITAKNDTLKTIDFNQIITKAISMLSGSQNFELVKFNVDVINSYNYNSNPESISAIFQNLIQNAIKYSKEANDAFVPQIDITVEVLQNKVLIKVCDNGQGIYEKYINRVFDLYYRANIQDVPGNGLGLYIVKNIVDDLNGKISVKSDVNISTCFEIELPNS